jgi:hypothetical protein
MRAGSWSEEEPRLYYGRNYVGNGVETVWRASHNQGVTAPEAQDKVKMGQLLTL